MSGKVTATYSNNLNLDGSGRYKFMYVTFTKDYKYNIAFATGVGFTFASYDCLNESEPAKFVPHLPCDDISNVLPIVCSIIIYYLLSR